MIADPAPLIIGAAQRAVLQADLAASPEDLRRAAAHAVLGAHSQFCADLGPRPSRLRPFSRAQWDRARTRAFDVAMESLARINEEQYR